MLKVPKSTLRASLIWTSCVVRAGAAKPYFAYYKWMNLESHMHQQVLFPFFLMEHTYIYILYSYFCNMHLHANMHARSIWRRPSIASPGRSIELLDPHF